MTHFCKKNRKMKLGGLGKIFRKEVRREKEG